MTTRGLTLLAQDTFTNVASVSFDNVFSANHRVYKIIAKGNTATGNSSWNLRMRANGTDYSSANYKRQIIGGDNTTVNGARNTTDTSFTSFFRGDLNKETISFTEIINPFETFGTSAISNFGFDITGSIYVGLHSYGLDSTLSYDGFTIFAGSGNNITGSVLVYGVNR